MNFVCSLSQCFFHKSVHKWVSYYFQTVTRISFLSNVQKYCHTHMHAHAHTVYINDNILKSFILQWNRRCANHTIMCFLLCVAFTTIWQTYFCSTATTTTAIKSVCANGFACMMTHTQTPAIYTHARTNRDTFTHTCINIQMNISRYIVHRSFRHLIQNPVVSYSTFSVL